MDGVEAIDELASEYPAEGCVIDPEILAQADPEV
jgi:hypothetical protein